MLTWLRPGQIAIFLAIVLVPLGIAAWLGLKVARDEQKVGQLQFQSLLESRLGDVNGTIARALGDAERHLLERVIPADRVDTESLGAEEIAALRRLRRQESLIREIFVMDSAGALVFPPGGANDPKSADASADERAFRVRTAPIWTGQAVLYEPPSAEGTAAPQPDPTAEKSAARKAPGTMVAEAQARGDTVLALARAREHGWITWYWEEGLHLLLWRRAQSGGVIGAEVERVVLLSRIVAKLPASELDDGRVVMLDSRGHPLHQWGQYEPAAGEEPIASARAPYPLDAWRVAHFASPAQRQAVFGQTLQINLILGLAAVALGLCAMAFLFYRDYARRLRDAAQRVSFVTQVSHELKTPLTNIRLYAELLEGQLDEDDPKAQQRAQVIIAESQRLTRLINNILTFSKQRRSTLALQRTAIDLDGVVHDVMEQFAPALQARGIASTLELASGARAHADPDAVGQIVANLVSNVEKYAADGKSIAIATGIDGSRAFVRVIDRGPGIAPGHRDKIFRPFYRASDKLADGVTGTGIGLSIARQLARQNGGDLRLLDSDDGAAFELSLELSSPGQPGGQSPGDQR